MWVAGVQLTQYFQIPLTNFTYFCKHDLVNVNLTEKPDWFLEQNPLGQVPVIECNDKVNQGCFIFYFSFHRH